MALRPCQHALAREPPDEDDLWFWLQTFGVLRNGLSAVESVAERGLPPEREELLGALFSSRQR